VTFLWLVAEPGRLSDAVRDACVHPANGLHLSSVSA
jgi:hypothetical protein